MFGESFLLGDLPPGLYAAVALFTTVIPIAFAIHHRTRKIEEQQGDQESEFETRIMWQMGIAGPERRLAPRGPSSDANGVMHAMARTQIVSAMQPYSEAGLEQDPELPAPRALSEARTASHSPQVADVARRLAAANLFIEIEGPLRCNNPSLRGQIISLKGGRRIAVIEGVFDAEERALEEYLLRHYHAVIVPRENGEPLLIRRFQALVGELISVAM